MVTQARLLQRQPSKSGVFSPSEERGNGLLGWNETSQTFAPRDLGSEGTKKERKDLLLHRRLGKILSVCFALGIIEGVGGGGGRGRKRNGSKLWLNSRIKFRHPFSSIQMQEQ